MDIPKSREDTSVNVENIFVELVEIYEIEEHPPGIPTAISEYFKFPSDLTFQLYYQVPGQDFSRTLDFQGSLKVAPGDTEGGARLVPNRYTRQLASLAEAIDFTGVPLQYENDQWQLSPAFKAAIKSTPFRIIRYPKKKSKYKNTHVRYFPQNMPPAAIWEDFKAVFDKLNWPKDYDPSSGRSGGGGPSSPGLAVSGSPPRSPSSEFATNDKPPESGFADDDFSFDDDVPF